MKSYFPKPEPPMFRKIHLAGVVGLATTLGGLIASPAVLALAPAKWAAVITAAGALIQATTRAIHKGDVEEIPK